ncbi:MAG: HD domain-containing protein [Bacteroidaceae bacterium]|nr:HD domain-containing protein [Bacteroidaceae bacterium]
MTNTAINLSLQAYIEQEILPQYDRFDKAHQRDHAETVMKQSLQLAAYYDGIDLNMVYAIAAYHDIGLSAGREIHHLVSAERIRTDKQLRTWFTEQQISVMADAAEDHRASSGHAPRTLYGRILAEADRLIDADTILRRTIQYGLANEPQLSRAEHIQRAVAHLQEKYAEGGYLKLWIPQSPNAARLHRLQQLIKDKPCLCVLLEQIFDEENS